MQRPPKNSSTRAIEARRAETRAARLGSRERVRAHARFARGLLLPPSLSLGVRQHKVDMRNAKRLSQLEQRYNGGIPFSLLQATYVLLTRA